MQVRSVRRLNRFYVGNLNVLNAKKKGINVAFEGSYYCVNAFIIVVDLFCYFFLYNIQKIKEKV